MSMMLIQKEKTKIIEVVRKF